MAAQHWYEGLHRRLIQETPRRGFFWLASALLAGVGLCTSSRKGGAKRKHHKHHGNGHGKGNGNGNKKPKPPSCSQGACAAQWPDDKANRDYCELICRQCDGNDPREFCIVEGNPADPARIAICCDVPAINCCGDFCTNLRDDRNNCGRCGNRCGAAEVCVEARCSCPAGKTRCADGCKDTQSDSAICRNCGQRCPQYWTCCEGTCYDLDFSSTNCSACGHSCPFGEVAPSSCCFGECVNTAIDPEHCGRCGAPCPFGRQCCGGLCYDPAEITCCPDNYSSCVAADVCCQDADGIWGCCEV
jgi:hypothetical protein